MQAVHLSIKHFFRGRRRRNPRLRAQQPVGATSGELTHLVGAGTVSEGEHRLDTKLLALLEQGTGGWIHSAVEHHVVAPAVSLLYGCLPDLRPCCNPHS